MTSVSSASRDPRLKTFQTLQAGRGIAALSVLLHNTSAYLGDDPRFWRIPIYRQIFAGGQFGVEFFFVLSGIVILLAHWKDQGVPSTIPVYLKKRFRRIYPVYWVILTLTALAFTLNPHLGNGYERNPWVLLSSFLLIHIHSSWSTIHVAWTLFHEVLFFIVFSVILLNRRLGYTFFALWMVASVVLLAGLPTNQQVADLLSPLHLFFALGMLITWIVKTRGEIPWAPPVIAGAAILGYALVASFLWWPTVSDHMLAGLGSAILLLGLMELERRGRVRVWPWLNFLGDASYSIYLVHFGVLSIVARRSFALAQRTGLPPWFWFLLDAAIALTVGILVHLTIERPLLRLAGRSPQKPRHPVVSAA